MKVFLGGTCNNSTWRDSLIAMLNDDVEYFNPVVEECTPESRVEEIRQRNECEISLYVITSEMKGVYSIAELIEDCHNKRGKTFFCFLEEGFNAGQIRSLCAVGNMVERHSSWWFDTLEEVASHVNIVGKKSYCPITRRGYISNLFYRFKNIIGG